MTVWTWILQLQLWSGSGDWWCTPSAREAQAGELRLIYIQSEFQDGQGHGQSWGHRLSLTLGTVWLLYWSWLPFLILSSHCISPCFKHTSSLQRCQCARGRCYISQASQHLWTVLWLHLRRVCVAYIGAHYQPSLCVNKMEGNLITCK